MPRKTTYLPLRQRRFIAKLAEGASVASAARQVGMSRAEVYVWRKENPKLAEEWDQVVATSIDLLEDEARKRAMEVSDGMLKLLLKCLRPEVWNPSVRRKSNRRKSNK
jgi:transposase-like protein